MFKVGKKYRFTEHYATLLILEGIGLPETRVVTCHEVFEGHLRTKNATYNGKRPSQETNGYIAAGPEAFRLEQVWEVE